MKEGIKTGWNSVYHQKKNGAFSQLPFPLMLMYFFAGFFFESHPETQGAGAVFFPHFTEKSNSLSSWEI